MNPKLLKDYSRKMGGVPAADAEREIIRIIQTVAKILAPSFTFGYHSREDIEQEGIFEALKVLESGRYDVGRPLENFIHVHMRNRLSNYLRKHYSRMERPCTCCDPNNPPAEPCKRFREWRKRNTSKRNIMRPVGVDSVSEEHTIGSSTSAHDQAISVEVYDKIDRLLPADLRGDYLRMRDHLSIPKVRRQKVREAVLGILGGDTPDVDSPAPSTTPARNIAEV